MRDRIYVSTSAFKTKKLGTILDLCANHGITNLELGSNVECSVRDLNRLEDLSKDSMNFLVHNYFPPLFHNLVINLASDDPDIIAKSMAQCRASIDLAAKIGAPHYSLHCGYAFDVSFTDLGAPIVGRKAIPLDKAAAAFLTNIIDLNGYAEKRGLGLLVENHEISRRNLVDGKNAFFVGVTSRDLKSIYEKVNSGNFGILVDLGHLKVTAASLKFDMSVFLKELGASVKAFHLSDNDKNSDLHLDFDDSAWFAPIVASSDAVLIIESHDLEIDQIRQCLEAVRRHAQREKVS